jgi:hypothetical protein
VTAQGSGWAAGAHGAAAADPELEAALKSVLDVLYKEHPLTANQILVLSSELQRIGVHRLVEEHLEKFRRRMP